MQRMQSKTARGILAPNHRAGATFFEIMVGAVISAIVFACTTALLNVVAGESIVNRPMYTYSSNYGTNLYTLSPAPTSLAYAATVLNNFEYAINTASAVFVLGGYRSSPGVSSTSGLSAPMTAGITFSSIPGITSSNFPQTSVDFRTILGSQSGVSFESSYTGADFTVITLSGLNTVSSITQVRKYTPSGDSNVYYEVVLDNNLTASRNSTIGSASQNRYSYRFAIPSSYDTSWTVNPGALHFWFRYDSTWQRLEEAPSRLVFPDPFILAGTQATVTANGSTAATTTAQFSRFIFVPGTTNN